MNRNSTIKKARKHYTLVEILVVIALMAILMGIGTASFNAATGKRGVRGSVSMVSSQINLARSVAVSKNSYVALLMPEPFSGKTANDNNFKPFFCNQMRLCFVKPLPPPAVAEFEFAGWIEGYDWVQLPNKTCAHPIYQHDYANLNASRPSYSVDKIEDMILDGSKVDSTGIVFTPSGRLASYNDVMIQAYAALSNANSAGKPDMRDLGIKFTDNIQGTSSTTKLTGTKLPYRRWCVSINKLTGRTEVTYAQPKEK